MDIYIIVKMYSAQDNVKEIDVNITSQTPQHMITFVSSRF